MYGEQLVVGNSKISETYEHIFVDQNGSQVVGFDSGVMIPDRPGAKTLPDEQIDLAKTNLVKMGEHYVPVSSSQVMHFESIPPNLR